MTEELQKKMQELAENYCANLEEKCGFYLKNGFCDEDCEEQNRKDFLSGAAAMYAHLAPLVEWNDVRERLPENEGYYLVKTLGGTFDVVKYLNLTKNLFWKCEVKHWRQIEL